MQVHTFIADSAADAVAQIRSQLGPQAVVLNVRPLPGEGLSRFWQKPKIEVLACIPEAAGGPVSSAAEAMAQLDPGAPRTSARPFPRNSDWEQPLTSPGAVEALAPPSVSPSSARPNGSGKVGSWRIGSVLENSGLLPMHAHRVLEQLRTEHGDTPPASLGRELELASMLLRDLWHQGRPSPAPASGVHVLVGAPGVGKTICLCKWLAQAVLMEEKRATVWRLDGRTANTAEALSVYCEILGIPVERCAPQEPGKSEPELLLIDLPGVNCSDASALKELSEQIQSLPDAQVHLVLNAAYETSLLLNQARAFAALPIADVIFTHLDEEQRWGKVWNVVLGTNFTISFLSAGQNVPGVWIRATAEQILSRQFPLS